MVAAAVLSVERKSRGMAPYWPTALATLTGYGTQVCGLVGSRVGVLFVLLFQLVFPGCRRPTALATLTGYGTQVRRGRRIRGCCCLVQGHPC